MKDLFRPKTDPWDMVTNEQLAFVKLMIEDEEFRTYVRIMLDRNLLDAIKFDPHELGAVIRTIREMDDVTYKGVRETVIPSFSDEISQLIVGAVLDECESGDLGNMSVWKNRFKVVLDDIADENYDDHSTWVQRVSSVTPLQDKGCQICTRKGVKSDTHKINLETKAPEGWEDD